MQANAFASAWLPALRISFMAREADTSNSASSSPRSSSRFIAASQAVRDSPVQSPTALVTLSRISGMNARTKAAFCSKVLANEVADASLKDSKESPLTLCLLQHLARPGLVKCRRSSPPEESPPPPASPVAAWERDCMISSSQAAKLHSTSTSDSPRVTKSLNRTSRESPHVPSALMRGSKKGPLRSAVAAVTSSARGAIDCEKGSATG